MSRRTWILIVLVAAMVMAACAPAAAPPTPAEEVGAVEVVTEAPEFEAATGEAAQWVTYLEGAKSGGTFVMSYHTDPTNLLPIFSTGGMQKYINQFHYGGLVRLAPDAMTWIPDIAESFEVSDDGIEYTFYLRTDVMTEDELTWWIGRARRVEGQIRLRRDLRRNLQRVTEKEISVNNFLLNSLSWLMVSYPAVAAMLRFVWQSVRRTTHAARRALKLMRIPKEHQGN